MARRPGLARSAARGISTGVTSRGTPGRAVQGGQPVRVGLGLQTVRLGFRRSRAAHRCSPPVSSATTPIPPCSSHALPGKGPGRRPREAPAGPGGWSAGGGPRGAPRFRRARLVRLRGKDRRAKPGMGPGRSRGKAPGSAEGDPVGKPRRAHGGMGVVAEPAAARRPGPGVSPVKHPRPAEGPGVLYVKRSPQPEFCGAIK